MLKAFSLHDVQGYFYGSGPSGLGMSQRARPTSDQQFKAKFLVSGEFLARQAGLLEWWALGRWGSLFWPRPSTECLSFSQSNFEIGPLGPVCEEKRTKCASMMANAIIRRSALLF